MELVDLRHLSVQEAGSVALKALNRDEAVLAAEAGRLIEQTPKAIEATRRLADVEALAALDRDWDMSDEVRALSLALLATHRA